MRCRPFIFKAVALIALFAGMPLCLAGEVQVDHHNSTGSCNSWPFNYSGQQHYMAHIAKSTFNGNSGKVIKFGFQYCNVLNCSYSQIEIYMGETAATPQSRSTTFASNYDIGGPTTMVNGAFNLVTTNVNGANIGWIDMSANPFNYTGQGSLVIEVVKTVNRTGSGTPTFRYVSNTNGSRMYTSGSATATTATSQSTNFDHGWSIVFSSGTTWTGANSSDWNDPGNWSDGVPNFDLTAEIPDSATTPNDPIIPDGAEVDDMSLLSGAVLVGDSTGTAKIFSNWDNQGGFYQPNGMVMDYADDDDQKIVTAGQTIGSIQVSNDMGTITVEDEFTAANTGNIQLDAGSNLTFLAETLNFTGISVSGAGQINLGLDGGGAVNTLQSVTTSGQSLGNVLVTVPDAMDALEFLGPVAFDSLTLEGMGMVSFFQPFSATTHVTNNMGGVFTCAGIDGSADLNFAGAGDVTIGATVNGGDLNHTGEGFLTLNGNVTLTGKASFVSVGPLTTATIGGNLTVGTGLELNPSFAGVGDALSINGSVLGTGDLEFVSSSATVFGAVNTDTVLRVTTDGTVTFGGAGISQIGAFELDGNGTAICAGFVQINGLLSTAGGGDFTGTATLVVFGDLNHNSTGNFEISGTLRMDGNAPQTIRTNGLQISASRLDFRNGAGTTVNGLINATSNGGFQVAATITANAGVILEIGSEIRLGSPGGVGLLHVQGALTTTSGASSLAPKIIGGTAVADHGRVRFRGTSRVNLNGIVFENIGPPSENYAVRLEDGASVLAFNHVTITDSNASTAAIELATDDVPTVFEGFSCSGLNNTGNIDATNIDNIRIEVRESDTGSGNLYGVPNEIDPNGVLIWENPPVVDILSAANLPNGLAEVPYSEMLTAAGGNEPLTWSIANNPAWLNINTTTGELFGTPGREDVGTHVFVVLASDDSNPSQSASKVMTIVIDSLTDVGVVIVTPPELLTTKVGEGYGYSLSAAGGSGAGYSWELVDANSLPTGLVLLPTGVIQGEPMPGTAGVYNFAVRVRDSQGNTGIKNFSMTVNTEFSDPAVIQAALNDGASGGSGGCTIDSKSTSWMLLALVALAGLFALRRRQA